MTTLLRCENISKFYEEGEQQVQFGEVNDDDLPF